MRKSPDAFRTISEVAQDLDLPQHVLRFWETRFSQIKPMKRGGGRRYYRPDDVDLLSGIRHLLYDQGYTIKGVQKILKEQGVSYVIEKASEDEGSSQSNDTVDEPDNATQDAGSHLSTPSGDDSFEENVVQTKAQAPLPRNAVEDHQEAAQGVGKSKSPESASSFRQHEFATDTAIPSVPAVPLTGHKKPTAPMPSDETRLQTGPEEQGEQIAHRAGSVQGASSDGYNEAAGKVRPNPEPSQSNTIAFRAALKRAGKPTGPAPYNQPPSNKGALLGAVSQSAHAAEIAYDSDRRENVNPVHDVQSNPDHQPHDLDVEPMPEGLRGGEPHFLKGDSSSLSVEETRKRMLAEEQRAGFFSRLISGRSEIPGQEQYMPSQQTLDRDEVRRLQSTLFELLECKRILDQARSD